ncbi:MAG: type II secretion system F family protein [Nanoarchaeota archaeon]
MAKKKSRKATPNKLEQNTHVFLGVLPYPFVRPFFRRFRGINSMILRFMPSIREAIRKSDVDLLPEDYITSGSLSYLLLATLFSAFIIWIALVSKRPQVTAIRMGLGAGLGIYFLLMLVLLRMPAIQARTKAEECDKYLLYALKDVVLQISSGRTLYETIRDIGNAGYSSVSEEFARTARKIESGVPLREALEGMANSTDSAYLRKASLQMINSLRAGADLRSTLDSIILELNEAQKSKIMNYARELNLWSLVYMMFAVAIPTIGSTMMVILSTFAGFGVSRQLFLMFIGICFVIQFTLMNFVKARRPVVQF